MKQIRSGLLLMILFMGTTFSSIGQFTQNIRGTVNDQILGTGIGGATVLLTTQQQSVVTDAEGKFRFSNVPVGTHTLRITHISFKEGIVANIVVNSGKETVLTISLEGNIKVEQEVVVKADSRRNKPMNEMSVVSARAFTVEEAQKYPAAVNDPLRMATNYAGVVSSDDGNNNIIIRGNSPTGLLWRMEGVDIPNPNHFAVDGSTGGGISILSAQLLTNSDFITGAFAAEYGNATSGVFDLRLRKGNNERREFNAQIGVLGLNVAAEGPLKIFDKGSYLVNYRYSTLGLLKNLGVKLGNGSTNFQDLSYNIHIPTRKFGSFSLFGFAGLSSLDNDPVKDSSKWEGESDRFVTFYRGKVGMSALSHSILLSDKTKLKTAISYSITENQLELKYIESSYAVIQAHRAVYTNQKLVFSSVANHKFNNRSALRSGVYFTFVDFGYLTKSKENRNPAAPLKTTLDVEGTAQTIQAFSQWQWKPGNRLTTNIGVHYLKLLLNNSTAVEPRASLKFDLNKRNNVSIGYGLHSQIQGLGVYYARVESVSGTISNPNKNLGLSKSQHFVISHNLLLGKNLKLKTELYYQQLFNIPVSTSDTNTLSAINIEGDYITESLTNSGKGRNYGFEISLEKYLSNRFYYMLSNSIYQSKYKASDGIERNTRFNGGFVSNLVAGKDFVSSNGRRTIGVNIRVLYSGGFRNTPVNIAESKRLGYAVYYQKEAYSLQNPNYFRTDTRLSITWNRRKVTSTLSLDIQNITNRLNIYSRSYDSFKGKLVDETQAGLIPILNYKIDF